MVDAGGSNPPGLRVMQVRLLSWVPKRDIGTWSKKKFGGSRELSGQL